MWYTIYGDVVHLNGIYVLTIHAPTINQHHKFCLTQWGKDILLSQWGDPICVITLKNRMNFFFPLHGIMELIPNFF
jgi:hypothetical protein